MKTVVRRWNQDMLSYATNSDAMNARQRDLVGVNHKVSGWKNELFKKDVDIKTFTEFVRLKGGSKKNPYIQSEEYVQKIVNMFFCGDDENTIENQLIEYGSLAIHQMVKMIEDLVDRECGEYLFEIGKTYYHCHNNEIYVTRFEKIEKDPDGYMLHVSMEKGGKPMYQSKKLQDCTPATIFEIVDFIKNNLI